MQYIIQNADVVGKGWLICYYYLYRTSLKITPRERASYQNIVNNNNNICPISAK